MAQHFKIVSPVHNARPWVDRFVQRVRTQTYHDWQAIIIDDCSDDGTYERLVELTREENRITLVRNTHRRLALANIVLGVNSICTNDEDVIVLLDGDDWFSDETVLDHLNGVYEDDDIWITWGSFVVHPGGRRGTTARPLPWFYNIRKGHFIFSHLRTAKHFLWKNIKDEDLRYRETQDYYPSGWDNALMRPMLEMAGRRHSRFVSRILYVYNAENPANDQKADPELQKRCRQEIYDRPPYRRMTKRELLQATRQHVILALTPWPQQKNLGDHAQALLVERWIRSQWPQACVQEYHVRETDRLLKRRLDRTDIIVLCSGGNVGDVWMENEQARRAVIQTFRDNPVISLPQSIDFRRQTELEASKTVYNGHPNLTFCARDAYSYGLAREHFHRAKVLLVPDIVLTYRYRGSLSRSGVLLCLRSDVESALEQTSAQRIRDACREAGLTCRDVDTKLERPIEDRQGKVDRMCETFAASRAVVTDRLHGLIFAIITSTPCVVLPPANHKIWAMRHWLRQIEFVRFCAKPEEVTGALEQVMNAPADYDPNWAREYYAGLLPRIQAPKLHNKEEALLDLMKSCRSTDPGNGRWDDLRIPAAVIDDILEAGRQATCTPASHPIRLEVMSGTAQCAGVMEQCLGHTGNPPSHLILVGYGPGPISVHEPDGLHGPFPIEAIGATIQNMRLYCEAIGISTCQVSLSSSQRQAIRKLSTGKHPKATFTTAVALGYAQTKSFECPTARRTPGEQPIGNRQ